MKHFLLCLILQWQNYLWDWVNSHLSHDCPNIVHHSHIFDISHFSLYSLDSLSVVFLYQFWSCQIAGMSFDLEILNFEQNAHQVWYIEVYLIFFITYFCQRSSTPHKIKNRDSYSGNLPGTLGIKAYYGAGCLNVHLGKAKLFGKRSQDPYARVYLFDEITQKCYFQRENKQTDVFNKNIEPNFNKTFYFKVWIFFLYY